MWTCKFCNISFNFNKPQQKSNHLGICDVRLKLISDILTDEFLMKEYIDAGKSTPQIAEETGFSITTIVKSLARHDIQIRTNSHSKKMKQYKKRIEETNLQKYGAINPLSAGTQPFATRNETVISKYGVDNVFQHPAIIKSSIKKKQKKWATEGHTSLGRKQSESTKLKIKEAHKKLWADPNKRKKARLKTIARLTAQGGQMSPFYNSEACDIIDEYGKRNGFNFQHAKNGGEYHIKELGYWVDGYDKERNVVIEYLERHHLRQIDKDRGRKQEIIEHLDCKFIEIKEWETQK